MIAAEQVIKGYGAHPVLHEVSATFRRGRVSYLLGRNGAGKTTFFKCLSGLEPFQGTITFDGQPLGKIRPELFPVFDDCALYPHLSGWENLHLLVRRKVTIADVHAATGGQVSATLLTKPGKALSYGQRKKVFITALALARPPYVFLDELANGLDYDSLAWLQDVITDLKKDSVVIAAGHQFDFYDRVADDVFALAQNRLTRLDFHPANGDRLEGAYLAHCPRDPD
ncbi:ATP-binding cassette domain-containing protein [Streptomyces venezuelae]|uniref:ABC transporter ATP-binding protein n=1 Tax=Streptomyces venezuelae TaxID=54571 RepID=UPI003414BF6C